MPRAIRFDRYGDLDELYVADVPIPEATADRVVVRVVATGLNPGEISVREGALAEQYPAQFPSGQGSDFAGVVEAAGEEVQGFSVGDDVLGWSDERGAQADFVSVPADHVTPKSEDVPWDVAGSLAVAGFTALSLSAAANAGEGSTVVVSGAAGGVGVLTVQLLLAERVRVIGLASESHHDMLRRLGAEPLDYHGDDLAGRIRSMVPDGVAALLDAHGGGYVQLGLDLGVPAEKVVTIIDFESAKKLGTAVTGGTQSQSAEALARLAGLVGGGRLEVPIQSRYPLEAIRDAYRELAGRHAAGKIVIDVAPQ